MPFVKGQSGNPGGRPKAVAAVEEVARQHTALAMNTLAEICGDVEQPASARVSAASTLLDRGWGKARQDIRVSVAPEDMGDEELARIAASGSSVSESDIEGENTRH